MRLAARDDGLMLAVHPPPDRALPDVAGWMYRG